MNINKLLEKVTNIEENKLGIKKDLKEALEIAKISYDMSMASLRKILEKILNDIYEKEYHKPPKETFIQKIKNQLLAKGVLPRRIKNHIETIQDFGNMSIHHSKEKIETEDLEMCFTAFFPICKWYAEKYCEIKTIEKNKLETKKNEQKTIEKNDIAHKNGTEKKKRNPLKIFFLSFIIVIALTCLIYFIIIPLVSKYEILNLENNNNLFAPKNLIATNNKINVISLSWNAIEGVEIYEIARSVKKTGVYENIKKTDEKSYDDRKNVYPDIVYYYKVRAVKDGEKSDYSNVVTGKVMMSPNKWIKYAIYDENNAPSARRNHAMTYLDNGKVILFGGEDNNNILLNDTWEYDINYHKWKKITYNQKKPAARKNTALAYNGNGKIVMFGGMIDNIII